MVFELKIVKSIIFFFLQEDIIVKRLIVLQNLIIALER